MRKVYAFDFDGTLTTKDTLLELPFELLAGISALCPPSGIDETWAIS